MGDAGAVFFAEALQLNDALTQLDLRYNQIRYVSRFCGLSVK